MIYEKILGIAACDEKGVMGSNGDLPWHCPDDLKHFSEMTRYKPTIMGYRTFLTLPPSYFAQRIAIVFTRQPFLIGQNSHLFFVSSLPELFALKVVFKELYVIGGSQIYELFLQENLIAEFVLTKMKNSFDGDTFFPLSRLHDWPRYQIRETDMFSIDRYVNPQER